MPRDRQLSREIALAKWLRSTTELTGKKLYTDFHIKEIHWTTVQLQERGDEHLNMKCVKSVGVTCPSCYSKCNCGYTGSDSLNEMKAGAKDWSKNSARNMDSNLQSESEAEMNEQDGIGATNTDSNSPPEIKAGTMAM